LKFVDRVAQRLRTMLPGGAKKVNFLEIGNFERPSLMHPTSERHQIFRFTRHVGGLVDRQVLARLIYNWGRYCMLNFVKSQNSQILGSPNSP